MSRPERRKVSVEIGTVETKIECSRCGGDHTVKFIPFSSPVLIGSYDEATHWAMCPKVNEPLVAEAKFEVLERVEEEKEETDVSGS